MKNAMLNYSDIFILGLGWISANRLPRFCTVSMAGNQSAYMNTERHYNAFSPSLWLLESALLEGLKEFNNYYSNLMVLVYRRTVESPIYLPQPTRNAHTNACTQHKPIGRCEYPRATSAVAFTSLKWMKINCICDVLNVVLTEEI